MYGLRRGEALSLCWQDINFNAGTASIRASVVEAAPLGVVMKNVKTRQSADTISLSDSVLTELRELRDRRRATDMYREGDPNVEGVTPWADLDPREYVCLNERDQVFNPNGFYQRLRHFQEINNLKVSGIHDLRRSYGTLLIESGVDVAVVSKALRHSSIKITSDIYPEVPKNYI